MLLSPKNSWKETELCLGGWDFLKKRKTRAEKTPVEFSEGTATSTQLRKSFQLPPNVFLLACKSVMCPLSVLRTESTLVCFACVLFRNEDFVTAALCSSEPYQTAPYLTLACERTKRFSSANSGDVRRASGAHTGLLFSKQEPGTVFFMQYLK